MKEDIIKNKKLTDKNNSISNLITKSQKDLEKVTNVQEIVDILTKSLKDAKADQSKIDSIINNVSKKKNIAEALIYLWDIILKGDGFEVIKTNDKSIKKKLKENWKYDIEEIKENIGQQAFIDEAINYLSSDDKDEYKNLYDIDLDEDDTSNQFLNLYKWLSMDQIQEIVDLLDNYEDEDEDQLEESLKESKIKCWDLCGYKVCITKKDFKKIFDKSKEMLKQEILDIDAQLMGDANLIEFKSIEDSKDGKQCFIILVDGQVYIK